MPLTVLVRCTNAPIRQTRRKIETEIEAGRGKMKSILKEIRGISLTSSAL